MADILSRNSLGIIHHKEPRKDQMKRQDREGVIAKLHELCPELGQLGIQPIVLGKGKRY